MAFEWDVFISYAPVDDRPLRVGEQGWVTRFHRLLEARLTQLMGTEPRILCRGWGDASEAGAAAETGAAGDTRPSERTGDSSSDPTDTVPAHGSEPGVGDVQRMETVAALVAVVSPHSVRSRDCARELQSFSRAATRTGGVRVAGSLPRLFKVVRTPVPLERQQRELQEIRGHNCFALDSDRPIEYGRQMTPTSSNGSAQPRVSSQGSSSSQGRTTSQGRATGQSRAMEQGSSFDEDLKFLQIVDDVAYDIQKLLTALAPNNTSQTSDEQQSHQPLGAQAGDKIVYLAETSPQLAAIREDVRRELELLGHWVLPDRPLPRSNSFADEIQASLALCDLSVHLLGVGDSQSDRALTAPLPSPGLQALHQETARVRTQVTLAANRLKDAGFAQILWVPGAQERDYWDTMLDALPGVPEVLLSGVEELKTTIQSYLERDPPIPPNPDDSELLCTVYVDFEQQDEDDPVLAQIRDWLDDQFEVLTPNYSSGEGVGSSEAKLRQADGVLIYYGQGSEVWLKRRLNAVRKTCSAGRSQVPRMVYVGQPDTRHKQNLDITQVSVLHPSEPFSPDTLQLFATRMTNART